ncbi:MAG: hypothetical protein GXP62_13415 [Oligoflexia bacterium]|nr:hypothetical protein [Oligoflexia bacterium]
MLEGATWDIDYSSVDSTTGSAQWDVTGTATVLAVDNIEIAAGIFATVPVKVSYQIIDYSSMFGDRSGTVTWYIAPGLGVISSIDTLEDGTLSESRELTSYDGFYVTDPADITSR